MIFASGVPGLDTLPARIRTSEHVLADDLLTVTIFPGQPDEFAVKLLFRAPSREDGENGNDKVCLTLEGVRDLRVSIVAASWLFPFYVQVANIRDRQMEKLNWLVDEYEQDRFFCYAEKAHLSLIRAGQVELKEQQ